MEGKEGESVLKWLKILKVQTFGPTKGRKSPTKGRKTVISDSTEIKLKGFYIFILTV